MPLNKPPIAALFGWLARRRTLPGVAVLCYHGLRCDRDPEGVMPFEGIHVRASTFAAHCRAIVRYAHPISLDDWRASLGGERALPPRPVVITFDDGYRSVLTEGLPVLEALNLSAAVFVATGAVARNEMLWSDAVASARGEPAVEALKSLSHQEWAKAIDGVPCAVSRSDPRALLTPDEVAHLSASGRIEVGGHTENHPILARAPREVQAAEIQACADAIERWTGRRMRAFAYPNGRVGLDLSDETRQLVAAVGADLAFTAESGLARRGADRLLLPRFTITNGVTVAHLLNRIARSWS